MPSASRAWILSRGMQLLTTEPDSIADGGTVHLLPIEGKDAGPDKESRVVEIPTGVANEAVGTCVLVTMTSGNNSDRQKLVELAVPTARFGASRNRGSVRLRGRD